MNSPIGVPKVYTSVSERTMARRSFDTAVTPLSTMQIALGGTGVSMRKRNSARRGPVCRWRTEALALDAHRGDGCHPGGRPRLGDAPRAARRAK